MVTDSDIEQRVIELFKKELPLVTTVTLKKIPVEVDSVLQNNFSFEDISDATDAYFRAFNVTYDNFYWGNYFPWKGKGFFSSKEPVQDKKPLTIKMFIESAKAGRWLYD
ncbi:DUF1493 family protein [Yersinia aldovae]|uniref:Phage-associated acyl carrier protein n=1 Tax=Yersinia aldovae TaxID=29483 RepID=A0ABM9T1E2_YERAL|nr:DUF1493 family protein [Yersinia aldovae]CNL66966.1 putative phage-associated acyl carrier protein [Yersinia aldovae]